MAQDRADVLVIGSGAAGGALSWPLRLDQTEPHL